MNKYAKTLVIICLIVISCGSNKKSTYEDYSTLFSGFIVRPENQVSYIKFPLDATENGVHKSINKDEWKPFKDYGGLIRIFSSEEQFKNFKRVTEVNHFVIIYIYPERNSSHQLNFINQDSSWYLTELKTTQENYNSKESFIGFLNKFMKDTAFREESIKFPIEYSQLDENANYTRKTDTTESYEKLEKIFDLRIATIVLILIQEYDETNCSSDTRILTFEEPGTSTNITYYFKQIDEKWYLIKYENLSV